MTAKRGRSITNFGGFLNPFAIGGSDSVQPTAPIVLTFPNRTYILTFDMRSYLLTFNDRSVILTFDED